MEETRRNHSTGMQASNRKFTNLWNQRISRITNSHKTIGYLRDQCM